MFYKNGIVRGSSFVEYEDYIIVGTPTIKDGIVSNFTSDNYIVTSYKQAEPITDIEINVDVITPSEWSSTDNRYVVLGQYGSNFQSPQIEVHPTRLGYGFSPNKSGWMGNWSINYSFQTNTRYSINIILRNGESKVYLDGNLMDTASISYGIYYSVPICIGADTNGTVPWLGSVDLNTFYVKINGNYALKGLNSLQSPKIARIESDCLNVNDFYEI